MAFEPSSQELHNSRVLWKTTSSKQAGLNIGIVASFTAEPIAPYLGTLLDAQGIPCQGIYFAPYNQILQTCMALRHSFDQDT